jgi:hypothetical protein
MDAPFEIRIIIARWRGIFKGLSQVGGSVKDRFLSKNLRDSLFNKYLWNQPNLSRIYFAGQYLYLLFCNSSGIRDTNIHTPQSHTSVYLL